MSGTPLHNLALTEDEIIDLHDFLDSSDGAHDEKNVHSVIKKLSKLQEPILLLAQIEIAKERLEAMKTRYLELVEVKA